MVRNSTVLLSMTHEDQKLQEVPPRAGQRRGNKVIFANVLSPHLCHQEQAVPAPGSHVFPVTAHCHAEECELLSESGHFPQFPHSSRAICSYLYWPGLVQSDHTSTSIGRDVNVTPSLLLLDEL